MPQVDQPAPDPVVHPFGADHGRSRMRPFLGIQHERIRLAAAHAPVRADKLLKRGHLVGLWIVGRVDHDVGHVRERVGAVQVPRRVRPVHS